MEKDGFFNHPQPWSSIFGIELEPVTRNWDAQMDHSDPFESALTSIVSSPVTSNSNSHSNPHVPIPSPENMVLKELIGRLGSICNSGEISPQSCIHNSTNTSCYNTPLNSPPKLNLSIMDHNNNFSLLPINHTTHQLPPADPAFVERAATFSHSFGMNESDFTLSNQSFKTAKFAVPVDNNSMEELESSLTEQIPQNNNSNARKRKAVVPKGKEKEKETQFTTQSAAIDNKHPIVEQEKEEDSDAKKSKTDEQSKEIAKPEPPKDYIHVRARRGQATDSHSLAERVRREKISERMKFLQDLVPGCNKVTGKAVMLDEIINYVQSLQRQVEFLSMKLSTVNPRIDMNIEALLSKDTRASMLNTTNHLDAPAQPFYGLVHDRPQNPLTSMMHHGSNMKTLQTDGFGEASAFWENDLQSVVQMGFGHNQGPIFHGLMGTGQMKVEL